MDRAPGKLPNTSSRLIALAASLVGSVEEVRARMRSAQADFSEYCASRKEPTYPELDALIKLIIHEQGKIIAANRELLARARSRQQRRT